MSFILLDTIQLPSWLLWEDELGWRPYVRSTETSIAGALVVQDWPRSGGRPITLSGQENSGWITRSTAEAVLAMFAEPLLVMTLTFPDARGSFEVMAAADAELDLPPIRRCVPSATEWHWVRKLPLITV